MRVRAAKEKPTAAFQQSAGHGDVVMAKVEEQHLEAIQGVGAGKKAELDQFADEAGRFGFRLEVDLILPLDVILEV